MVSPISGAAVVATGRKIAAAHDFSSMKQAQPALPLNQQDGLGRAQPATSAHIIPCTCFSIFGQASAPFWRRLATTSIV